MVAGHHAYNKVVVPQLDLWQHLFGPTCKAVFHEDNESMIQVIRTGRNPTMRQLGRVHRVAIAVLHERLGNPDSADTVDLIHTGSEDMAADIYTKSFTNPDSWGKALRNINVFKGANVPGQIKHKIKIIAARQHAAGIHDPLEPNTEEETCVDYDTNDESFGSHSMSKKSPSKVAGGPPVAHEHTTITSSSKSKKRKASPAASVEPRQINRAEVSDVPCLPRGDDDLFSGHSVGAYLSKHSVPGVPKPSKLPMPKFGRSVGKLGPNNRQTDTDTGTLTSENQDNLVESNEMHDNLRLAPACPATTTVYPHPNLNSADCGSVLSSPLDRVNLGSSELNSVDHAAMGKYKQLENVSLYMPDPVKGNSVRDYRYHICDGNPGQHYVPYPPLPPGVDLTPGSSSFTNNLMIIRAEVDRMYVAADNAGYGPRSTSATLSTSRKVQLINQYQVRANLNHKGMPALYCLAKAADCHLLAKPIPDNTPLQGPLEGFTVGNLKMKVKAFLDTGEGRRFIQRMIFKIKQDQHDMQGVYVASDRIMVNSTKRSGADVISILRDDMCHPLRGMATDVYKNSTMQKSEYRDHNEWHTQPGWCSNLEAHVVKTFQTRVSYSDLTNNPGKTSVDYGTVKPGKSLYAGKSCCLLIDSGDSVTNWKEVEERWKFTVKEENRCQKNMSGVHPEDVLGDTITAYRRFVQTANDSFENVMVITPPAAAVITQ